MPSDDRERSFQNALARHLRPGVPGEACADAETLAAYHERSLAPPQMISLKAHISKCNRCQETLAQLQATEEIPMPAANIAVPQTAPANSVKSSVRVLAASRPILWRWVAPAGALAAALLVWIAVRENNVDRVALESPRNDTNQTQTAKAQPAPVLPRSSIDPTRKSGTPATDENSSSLAASSSQTAVLPQQRPHSAAKQKDFQDLKKRSPSAAGVGGAVTGAAPGLVTPSVSKPDLQPEVPRGVTESVTVEPAASQATNQVAAADQAKKEAEAKSANERRDAASSRSTPSSSVIAGAASAPAPPPPSSSQSVEVTAESSSISNLPVQNRDVTNLTNLNRGAQLLLASSGAITVSAPGGRVSWRIGPAGVILFTPDAGKTWLVQPSGIITDLLAGSAPSAKVCWIVGRGGTILRTTDKGKHWKKVQPPTQDDLVSVFAMNDRQATVSPANGTYQTTDGGATWTKLPPE
jgi:hypothetical protein